jgi:hypothetical protein
MADRKAFEMNYWIAKSSENISQAQVNIVADGQMANIKLIRFAWTTEAPTQAGWYWVITNDLGWGNSPECVYVGCPEYDDILHVYGINPLHQIESVNEYHKKYLRHWLGPVIQPEPPKE